jgi:hypothetical protein
MELAEVVAWAFLALLFAWVGLVLFATWMQVREEQMRSSGRGGEPTLVSLGPRRPGARAPRRGSRRRRRRRA